MSARDAILSAIRTAHVPSAPAADLAPVLARRMVPEDLHAHFIALLRAVGGRGAVIAAGSSLSDAANALYDAGVPRDPLDTELNAPAPTPFVVRGRFAVAENAAVYVDAADLQARNSIILAEHLVVVVPFDAIVPTMHEAVRLMPADSGCGWFLSGPSKTADIEMNLVYGAQGTRAHTVLFER